MLVVALFGTALDYVEYYRASWHARDWVPFFRRAVQHALAIQTSVATIAVVPVLIYWLLFDIALGAAILLRSYCFQPLP